MYEEGNLRDGGLNGYGVEAYNALRELLMWQVSFFFHTFFFTHTDTHKERHTQTHTNTHSLRERQRERESE